MAPVSPQWLPRGSETEWVKSVCRFCGTGCGVMLGVRDKKLVALRGDPEHPTTKGLVCAKALFLPKIVRSADRLKYPMIRKNGELQRASWEEAMDLVAQKFAGAIEDHGPDSVAYYGSGQALSEESYLANRVFKGGIGTNNVEGNPRLCMASAVGGYVTTFGKDEPMGCYDDIDHAKVFFLVGSNTAECHPVIFDQILASKESKRDVLVIVLDRARARCSRWPTSIWIRCRATTWRCSTRWRRSSWRRSSTTRSSLTPTCSSRSCATASRSTCRSRSTSSSSTGSSLPSRPAASRASIPT